MFPALFPESHEQSVNICLGVGGGRLRWEKGAGGGWIGKQRKKKCELFVVHERTLQLNVFQTFWFYAGIWSHDLIKV